MTDILADPDVLDALTDLAVTLAGLAVTVLSVLASTILPAWARGCVEGAHRKALHEAAATWAETAVRQGVGPATARLADGFRTHAERSVPDALRALTPPNDVLLAIAERYPARARA